MTPEVVNMKTCNPPWGQPGDVRIDRGTIWGNPFRMYFESERDKVVKQYENYIRYRLDLLNELQELAKAKRLGCHCAPKACHGDVLVSLMKEMHLA